MNLCLRFRRTPLAAFLLVLLAGCSSDRLDTAEPLSPLPTGAEEVAATIDPAALEAHLRNLADDSMEGRGPGSAGSLRARSYIAGQLSALGVEPGAPGASWEQSFDLIGLTPELPPTWSFRTPRAAIDLRPGVEIVAASGLQSEQVWADAAEIVFVGYGIDAPEYGWNDFKGVDLHGKFLLIMNNDPDWDPALFAGNARLYYGRWTYKYESAIAHGALGALIIHTTSSAGYPWPVVQNSWGGERFSLPSAGEPHLQVQGWIGEEAASRIVALGGFDLARLRRGARTRDFRPIPLGVETSIAFRNRLRKVQTANVIGVVTGRDPDLANEAVVFSAHYDHLGMRAGSATGDTIYNGALDNASGVSMILEIARAVAALPEKPRRSTVFALFGAEEQGLLGSRYYTLNPTFAPGRIAANINIDGGNVLGRTADISSIGYGKSSLDAVVEAVARQHGRRVTGDIFPDRGSFYRSDQFNFAKIGVPALYLKPGIEFIGRPEGWGIRQVEHYTGHDYHQVSDELDPSWTYDGMAEDVRLALLCGLLIAESEEFPAWKPGGEFEAARLASRAAVGH